VNDSDFRPVATATVRWLPPDEGGRRSVPPGPSYAATARISEREEDVSIVIRYRGQVPTFGAEFDADIAFLAPELVRELLAAGVQLALMEGPRRVAAGRVTRVTDDRAS
jgi:hypothetical protein